MLHSKKDKDELFLPWERQLEGRIDNGALPYYHQLAKDLYRLYIWSIRKPET